jgi:3,4-dihydroxy-2-butanone 4-phosphate synthase
MTKGEEIDRFAGRHGMVVLSIAELVEHRLRHDKTRAAATAR